MTPVNGTNESHEADDIRWISSKRRKHHNALEFRLHTDDPLSIPSSCNAVKVYKRVRQLSNRLLSIAFHIMTVLPEHYDRILTHSADTFERLPDHFPIFQSDAIGYEAFKLPYQQSLCILLICPQFRFVSKFGDKESNGSIVQSLKTVQMVYKSFTMTKLLPNRMFLLECF